jgi:hypothetical protein
MVAMRWSSLCHNAVAQSAVDRLQFLDQHLRQFARSRGDVCILLVDRQKARLRKSYDADERGGQHWESIGAGVKIAELRIGNEKTTSSEQTISFDAVGCSPTYGLHLKGPGTHEAWLVFAGVSGQMTKLDTEAAWNATLRLLEPPSL